MANKDPEYFEKIVSNQVSAMLAYWDTDLVCRYANDAYLLWFGKRKEEMIGKITLPELLGPELYAKNRSFIDGALKGEYQSFERQIPLPSGEGYRYSIANYFPDTVNGTVRGFVVHVADITPLKLLELELTESNELVKEQNKRLLNFANIVTHNLRSYANNLGIMLDMFDKAETSAESELILNFLKDISLNFSSTISNLTDIVDIQNKKGFNIEKISLKYYVGMIKDILRVEISAAGAIVVNKVSEQVTLLVNPAYMESVLLNLVSNAIKYRHPDRKPMVEIDANIEDSNVIITIADNGLGIDLNRYGNEIFGLYKTFHGNKDAKGVGLYLVRSQVEAMGGTVELKSEVGMGSIFILLFRKTYK